jgi:hypothetical protein
MQCRSERENRVRLRSEASDNSHPDKSSALPTVAFGRRFTRHLGGPIMGTSQKVNHEAT